MGSSIVCLRARVGTPQEYLYGGNNIVLPLLLDLKETVFLNIKPQLFTMWLQLALSAVLVTVVSSQGTASQEENCLLDSSAGCSFARIPEYMIIAPRRIRPRQVFQVFASILHMEYYMEYVHVHVSIIRDDTEYAGSVIRFDRPSSRILQLQMPSSAQEGNYKLRVEGRLEESDMGNIWENETDIELYNKQASLFMQMSRPLYRQGQMVHFRVIPILPNMMPKYGSMIIYIDDPSGFPVRRWQGLQTNAGGIVSQSFQLSDQPNYGTWHIRVNAFGTTYKHPFIVEEFWEPRFDVNVSVPPYMMIMKDLDSKIKGVVLANHTSGRPCKGNASISVFFRPREDVWNSSSGWTKPYYDALRDTSRKSGLPMSMPDYMPVKDVRVKDYHMYFPYHYKFIDYFDGRIDFQYSIRQLLDIAVQYTRDSADFISQNNQVVQLLENSEFVFFVNITDWYSGLNRTGWAGTIMFDSKIKLKFVGGAIRTFKPNSMMKVQVAVSKYDGTPVIGGSVTINDEITHTGESNSRYLSGPQTRSLKKGIAEFEYTLGPNAVSMTLEASYDDGGKTYQGGQEAYQNPQYEKYEVEPITMRAWRYYSPSNSYITIMTSTDYPKVNEFMIFHVRTTTFVPRIYYQVIAQSNIIIGDELEMTSNQKTFAVALSREMVPTARIVVFYIRQPEELVVDVLNFFVDGTGQNQVKLEINRGKDFSRDTIEFNAYADPGSYVAFSGMLLDLYSRGLSDGITENKLIDELMTYDSASNSSYKQLWRVSDTEFEYNFFHGYDYGVDATTSFDNAGLVVLTDARIPRIFNEYHCRKREEGGPQMPCFTAKEGDCFLPSEQCNGVVDGCPNDGADEWGCPEEPMVETHDSPLDRVSRVMRFFDNSSWAWQEIFVKPNGRVDFRVDVPKYPLSWVINGISVSRDLGLGIMRQPVRYDAARYMYIQVEHPTHIIRGEQIGVRVTVFNYWYDDDYLEVLITMHGGPDTEFVTVGNMGVVSSYSPTTHKGDHQTIVFLEPGESKDIYMPIMPDKRLVRGKLTFRVSATCFMEKDEYVGTMYVAPDGVINYYHTPYLIDLIRYGSIKIPEFEVPVEEQFRELEVRENKYVPESGVATMSLFGDIVTPGFFEDYLNAENILHRPYGGGEMIAFNFAYNLYTLFFMKASEQLDPEQLSKSLKEMNIALQRILGYMNATDGSMKMFRDDDTPSLWLTAFVAKIVHEANFGEWERDFFIPRDLINKMVLYICSRQNKTSGAFEPLPGDITYDRKMTSLKSLKTDMLRAHPIPLTAYILIALYETMDVSGEAANLVVPARRNAAEFLYNSIDEIDEVFHLAITTYALSLSGKPAPWDKLWEMRRNDSDFVYFADKKVYQNPSDFLNTVRYIKPRQELMNDAYAVQTTAYAMMAHIETNQGFKYEREMMMSWINEMRNSIGGFASTQDTILAMEAMYKFTQKDPHRNEFKLETMMVSTTTPPWQAMFTLLKENYIRLIKASLPADRVFGFVSPSSQGTGRAMLQLTTTVNVEFPWLLKTPQRDLEGDGEVIKFFDLYVQRLWFGGRNDSILEMENCVSWVYTNRSLTSGLAVLEVDIPTGYIVMNDTLRNYVRSGIVPNLKRAEFYGRKVVYYFDYLGTGETCVFFRADRWYPVANATIQHRMRVYDYYEPGMHNTTMYTTKNLFLLNICFVCGSYQCPYCPYFNTATLASAGLNFLFFLAAVFLVQRLLLRNSR
ncbi:Cd109 antigen-like isoform x3 [Plakobranchus ocellatus]|uniref:Cd109 antigen-like isoform x3 n=1 Tax=Plakobranchus ocellatus TaxID=259542 RepID=A0AAV4AXP7_9GAST|nr:Cd109 antigen-like isoform x3 [Plakobranchus ocellatus]